MISRRGFLKLCCVGTAGYSSLYFQKNVLGESLEIFDMRRQLPVGGVSFLAGKTPSFHWKFPQREDAEIRRGLRQVAYQIRVAPTAAALNTAEDLLWDTGKVESDASLAVPYAGKPLSAGQRVFYDVRVWDEIGESFLAREPRECVVAELEPADWQARWIGPEPDLYPVESAALLRRDFELCEKPVRACLFVTGLGNYEAFLNGNRELIVTDEAWTFAQSPVIYCSLFAGETLDARLNQPAWASPGFDAGNWTPVVPLDPPSGRLQFQTCLPTGRFPKMAPVSVEEIGDGERLYDFGVTLCGGVAVVARGEPGQTIEIHKSELTSRKRNPNSLDQPGPNMIEGGRIQEDRLILCEDGKAEFETTFSISGFRYALIRGAGKAVEDDFTIRAFETRAAVPLTGHFECSNPKVNALHEMFLRTFLSNMQCGIPTDNPTRERRGYGMDGQQWAEAMLYNGDTADFYRKWAIDNADAQQASGFIPYYQPIGGKMIQSPDGRLPQWSDPWWSNQIASVPLMVHQFSGDMELLALLWPNIRRLLVFLDEQYL